MFREGKIGFTMRRKRPAIPQKGIGYLQAAGEVARIFA